MGNKLIIVFLFMSIAWGCGTTKTVSFKIVDNKGQKFHFQTRLPKGYIVRSMNFENEKATVFIYSDSSRFFFSDNTKPSAFYPDAYKKYGKDLAIKFLSKDTITISGIDEAGKFWKLRKAKIVVYGYMKVPAEKKRIFDSIFNSVTIK
ncbi:MAG: hypothetical protein IRZ03_17335 [Acidobacterium ailaaui]|nr:hypothetical protein [Pseudacidobacterium ailaaui]